MSLNRNYKIKCKVFWKKGLQTRKAVETFINSSVEEVEKDYDVYDFSISEDGNYCSVYVKYKEY